MKTRLIILCTMILCSKATSDDAKPPIKHQVTGLFAPDREDDLREVMKKLPGIKLVSIDFKNAEALFGYSPATVFPKAKPDEVIKQFDNMIRFASNGTFGIKPIRTILDDKLKLIEIPVVGLDCKACSLAAYEAIYKLDGVEQATASFKEGRVTALIDAERTDRGKLEEALKKKGVQLRSP